MALKLITGGAGAGKTYACWEEMKTLLAADPLGTPCIMLVPEQASFSADSPMAADGKIFGATCVYERNGQNYGFGRVDTAAARRFVGAEECGGEPGLCRGNQQSVQRISAILHYAAAVKGNR